MPLFSSADAALARSISRLVYCNPFLPERIAAEREALGLEFQPTEDVWSVRSAQVRERENVLLLQKRVEALAAKTRGRLSEGHAATPHERELYQDVIFYLLYYRAWQPLQQILERDPSRRFAHFGEFQQAVEHFFRIPGVTLPHVDAPEHLLALFYQIARAFRLLFRHLVGGSLPAARLRAAAWQSIFTHDLRRYHRGLHRYLGDIPTLITGPSGTGKELVARAIALSRFIPFDPVRSAFRVDVESLFFPLNLAALSPTLIESELFGHRRGAFTGAMEDRTGWLETCPALGTVFLDEIGETDGQIQVKLLRVLQSREFQRLGDTATRHFAGKIIAATNRDLAAEMLAGSFRTDFFYRLCADQIATPSLHEQLAASPDELARLVQFIAERVAGEHAEALASEVVEWINAHLGADYPWPGNFRELEQCVRNILIRRSYAPPATQPQAPSDILHDAFRAGRLSADEMLSLYCRHVYRLQGSYEAAARQLGMDRRTVKAKVSAPHGIGA